MGLVKRLKRITRARIEALLDSLEDPAQVLPQLVRELAQQVQLASDAEAKALSAVRAAQRRLDEAAGRAARLGAGALQAVQAGQEDLAREALHAQIKAQEELRPAEQALAAAQAAHDDAHQVRCHLQGELEHLRGRSRELVARSHQAHARKTVQSKASPLAGAGSILEEVIRMEDGLAQAEAAADSAAEIGDTASSGSAQRRLEKLEHDAEIDRRLEELKRQMRSQP